MKNIFNFFVLFFCIISFAVKAEAATVTASVSGNWSSTSTWGGSPIPLATDDVVIGHGVAVIVDTSAVANTITFSTVNNVSAESSITISGTNSLSVVGAINLEQTAVVAQNKSDNIINVGAGTLSASSIFLKGIGTAQYRLAKVTVGNGTVNVTDNITSLGTSSRFVFTGAGTLNIGGSFMSGTAGTFTASTGTVNFNGSNQTISPFPYTFFNVNLSGTGTKILTNATISGLLSVGNNVITSGNYTTLSSMTISNPADKLIYNVGDTLSISGLVVTITYGDNSTKIQNVTAENISGFDSSLPVTEQTLTITIGDKIATYKISIIAPLSSNKLISSFKLRQIANGIIDESAKTINISVPYGTDITNMDTLIEVSQGAIVSPLSGVAQDFTNPIFYTVTAEDNSTQIYTVTVTIEPAPVLSNINITTPASKLRYTVGDSLDISGLVITGTYSDASTKQEIITSENISGFNSNIPISDQVLTISIGGKTTTYNIDIIARISSGSSGGGGGGSYSSPTVIIPKVITPINTKEIIPVVSNEDGHISLAGNITKTIRINSTSDDVKKLQIYLNTHGFIVSQYGVGSPGKETNYFGSLTKKAVIAFQKANKLKADGIVGIKTISLMK